MITPGNVAAAVNANCSGCDSFAFAYQYVLTTPGPVYLNSVARQEIAQLRQQVAATTASGLPDDEIDAQLQTLAGQFKTIIDQNLQQAGVSAQATVNEHVDSAPTAG